VCLQTGIRIFSSRQRGSGLRSGGDDAGFALVIPGTGEATQAEHQSSSDALMKDASRLCTNGVHSSTREEDRPGFLHAARPFPNLWLADKIVGEQNIPSQSLETAV